jgi:hypothetical protein
LYRSVARIEEADGLRDQKEAVRLAETREQLAAQDAERQVRLQQQREEQARKVRKVGGD